MSGDPLLDQDHVSRYCAFTTLLPDGRPSGASFMLKDRADDKFLSVNWLEYFNFPDQKAQIAQVRRVIRMKLGTTAKFAVLSVGETIEHVHTNSDKRTLAFLREPTEEDPSHSGIHGYGHEDVLVAELIAEVVRETYPAKEP